MKERSIFAVSAQIVHEMAAALAAPVAEREAGHLVTWLTELAQWNRTHDLTAARDQNEFVDLMLADALVLSRVLERDRTVIDVGSGAGAPGLALALMRPDLKVTLAEPLQKRVSFLRLVVAKLGRLDVVVEAKRGEAMIANDALGTWDVAISRATLAPVDWLALGKKLVHANGEIDLLLARDAAPQRDDCEIEATVTYEWPRTHATRSLVRYRSRHLGK